MKEDFKYQDPTGDYDLVAKVPFTKSFKVKVKIRSIKRLEPKVILD